LKPEQWGSPLVQEKYQEEETCDKRHPYHIIIIIIIIIVMIISDKKYGTVFRCSPSNNEACSRNFAVVTTQGWERKHVQVTIGNTSASHVTVFNCCFELTKMCAETRDRKFAVEA